jgi:hypothetical protein
VTSNGWPALFGCYHSISTLGAVKSTGDFSLRECFSVSHKRIPFLPFSKADSLVCCFREYQSSADHHEVASPDNYLAFLDHRLCLFSFSEDHPHAGKHQAPAKQ